MYDTYEQHFQIARMRQAELLRLAEKERLIHEVSGNQPKRFGLLRRWLVSVETSGAVSTSQTNTPVAECC